LTARNILLFTLLIDDTNTTASDMIWDIYYHLYLDNDSLRLLDSQAVKLLGLSDTLENWNAGRYGHAIRFCDQRTLAKVNSVWAGYSGNHLTPQEKLNRKIRYQATIDKARVAKKQMKGEGLSLSGIRSAAPVGILALQDLQEASIYFWEHGTVDQGKGNKTKLNHPNPAFASSSNQALTLHYGLDPLIGFHLATAYAPMTPNSPLCPKHQPTFPAKTVVEAAQIQFREWSKSFRQSVKNGSTIRFFTGDALAFCHALQQVGATGNSDDANLYCESWTFQPLKLDGGDHESPARLAPSKFGVIDTSNLVDHLGAINILVAAAPLLVDRVTSTLYTEVLVQHETSVQSRVDNILCGHYGTVSLLLGLALVESWTNATAVADVDEGMLDAVSDIMKTKAGQGSTQLRTRLCWKLSSTLSRSCVLSENLKTPQFANLEIDARGLSRLLHSIYQAMFCHEDTRTLMARVEIQGLQKVSNPYYTRASFVALLKHVKSNIIADWEKTISHFLNILEEDVSPFSLSRNYLQELYLCLHISGIYTVQVLQNGAPKPLKPMAAKKLFSWDDVPPVLCITFEVPRENLKTLKEKPLGALGTPSLCCTVQASRTSPQQWANNFSAVQVAFGNINLVGSKNDADFHIDVNEDSESWAGNSPLVVSFFIPTWIVLLEPRTALVACGLQSTPQAAASFFKTLGPELRIFETNLGDERKVHITKFMPHMSASPIFAASSNNLKPSSSSSQALFRNTISANIATDGSQIAGMTCKIDFICVPAKTKLSDKTSLVELKCNSPMVSEVTVGKTIKCRALFPVPVSGSRSKLRIARKSSYVEVIAPVLSPLHGDASLEFMFPLSTIPKTAVQEMVLPVNWNMPYVPLDVFPILDTKKTSKMQWLITHASLMFSSRERKIREAGMSGQAPSTLQKDPRVDFKDGLFSLFMHFTGLQGGQANVFGLHKAGAGGVHVLLIVSALKLDIANHTVILDTAVLPLSHKPLGDSKVQKFLGGLQSTTQLCSINVTDKELRLWKHILPALAERCRTWKHKPESCEYLLAGEIPAPKGLEDGNTPLCSCGNGQLPEKFMEALKIPHLEYVLQKYATRIAISPIFAVPYVEDCFLRDMPRGSGGSLGSGSHLPTGGLQCNACGSDKKREANATSQALLTCMRCKLARYCSKECQKVDWEEHKTACVPR
jgi:MYND finger